MELTNYDFFVNLDVSRANATPGIDTEVGVLLRAHGPCDPGGRDGRNSRNDRVDYLRRVAQGLLPKVGKDGGRDCSGKVDGGNGGNVKRSGQIDMVVIADGDGDVCCTVGGRNPGGRNLGGRNLQSRRPRDWDSCTSIIVQALVLVVARHFVFGRVWEHKVTNAVERKGVEVVCKNAL